MVRHGDESAMDGEPDWPLVFKPSDRRKAAVVTWAVAALFIGLLVLLAALSTWLQWSRANRPGAGPGLLSVWLARAFSISMICIAFATYLRFREGARFARAGHVRVDAEHVKVIVAGRTVREVPKAAIARIDASLTAWGDNHDLMATWTDAETGKTQSDYVWPCLAAPPPGLLGALTGYRESAKLGWRDRHRGTLWRGGLH